MEDYKIIYGDFHFHTLFSDNQDKASIFEMIEQGMSKGLTVFGTGDHNHNITYSDWLKIKEETKSLQYKYPQLQLMNNCEITFRCGHFLVLNPKVIKGTAEEGLSYLFSEDGPLLVINHPYLPTDSWKGTILRHAAAVEVINGEVLNQPVARQIMKRIAKQHENKKPFMINIPHIACYADYLSHGVLVVPFGCSDSHKLRSIGYGVTGMLDSDLLSSMQEFKLFAAVDTGISLVWDYDSITNTIEWQVEFLDDPTGMEQDGEEVIEVEWYQGKQFVNKFRESGCFNPHFPGIYWFTARKGQRFGVSSPIVVGEHRIRQPQESLYESSFRRLYSFWSQKYAGEKLKNEFLPAPNQDSIYSGELFLSEKFKCIDVDNRPVQLQLKSSPNTIDTVICKENHEPKHLDEFFVWLERNEIHEYIFGKLDYSELNGFLQLKAVLIPACQVKNRENDDEIRHLGKTIRKLRPNLTKVSLVVEVLPLYHLELINPAIIYKLPLTIIDDGVGWESQIYFSIKENTFFQEFIKKVGV